MRKVGIIPNLEKDKELKATKRIFQFMKEKQMEPILPIAAAQKMNKEEFGFSMEEMFKQAEFLVVLGGDGTLLSVGRQAAKYDTPLLGINLGTLGFLTDAEESGAFHSIDQVIQGNYTLERRLMLDAFLLKGEDTGESFVALNDVCITRGVFSKIINLRVHVNQEYLDTFRADGIIISTPTGSTAYNLSAGGPILKPDTKMVAITPICPHALHARSIVISAEDVVTVEMAGHCRGDLLFSVDGMTGIPLNQNGIVQVQRSNYYTTIMKTNQLGFYDILRRKLVRNEG